MAIPLLDRTRFPVWALPLPERRGLQYQNDTAHCGRRLAVGDDIVEQLRAIEECLRHHDCVECDSSWGRSCACLCHQAVWSDAADEIERLRRWQSQATTVIENWDAVFDALIDAKPTDLGVSKSVLVAKEIIWLRAEAARLGAFLHPIGEQARRG